MSLVNKAPIAEQIYTLLLERIKEEIYQPGERIPSESELAAEMDVSRSSVRTALVRLETSGQISRKHGEGTFVKKRPPASTVALGLVWEFSGLIRETGRESRIEVMSRDIRPGTDIECSQLEIDPGDSVFELVRIFYADDDPVIYTSNVIPLSLLKADSEIVDGTLVIMDVLERYFGLEIGYIDTHISGDVGGPVVEEALRLPPCAPLLHLEEIFFCNLNEKPILLSDSYLNTMKVQLHRIRPWEDRIT